MTGRRSVKHFCLLLDCPVFRDAYSFTMFSVKTKFEIIKVLDKISLEELKRIISIFGFSRVNFPMNATRMEKTTSMFHELKYADKLGPFEQDPIEKELLQYIIDLYFVSSGRNGSIEYIAHNVGGGPNITNKNAFEHEYKELAHSLKRDGYIVEHKTIRKLLPTEIEEQKIESELFQLIVLFGFEQTKGHLDQAIKNHTQGNWAAANSQFRSFIESLLVEISAQFCPENKVKTGSQAMKVLAGSVNPPFLSEKLNEISFAQGDQSFVHGLFKRLHSEGPHPGLSDEDDSSFRYYLSVVFGNYLLRRLKSRQ